MGMAIDVEIVQTVAKVRKLLKEGYGLTEVGNMVGWSIARVYNVREGLRHVKTSLPINELDLCRPSKQGAMCRRCGNAARIFTKGKLCIECELFELAKLGLVVILEPESGE